TIVWAILVLSVILGIINAFDVPARQALIHEVVAVPADLSNALSLTTATASLAQLLGPALSGLVLSTFGAAVCFFINAASFGAVLVSLLLMKLPEHKQKKSDKKIITEFAEGLAYVGKTKNIGLIILMLGMVSLLVLPYNTVLPVFAKVIFKGDASTFGYISSFVGVGALFATIFLASRRPGAQLKKLLFVFTMIMSAGLIFFSQARNFPLAMLAAVLAGFGSVAQFTISNIIVQSEAAPEMRGRAIGVLLMAIFGMLPIGSLLVGAASEHIGAPATVLIQGIVGLVIVTVFARCLLKRGKPAIPSDLLINEAEEIMAEQHV
ncbi:MAG: MFS transporter, partial [Bacteroidota bacterium]|nr:MFS transporter [Bacteroidota bacterium]